MNKPLVSICLPIFNGKEFLQEALDSIKNQTYENIELIVSDDNSIDNSINIIIDFKKSVNFPVFIFNHKPSGIGANWNNCVINSNGDYIKFLFQDDKLESNCIEKMVKYALKSQKIGLVYSKRNFLYDRINKKNTEWIKSYGNLHLSWKNNKVIDGKINKGVDLLKDNYLLSSPQNKVGEPTAVLIKKEVFKKVGFFSEELKQNLDIEFWYRLMKFFDVIFVDEALLSFRLHENQTTNKNLKAKLNESFLFYKSIYNNLFWQLSFNWKRKLFFDYNYFGKKIKIVISYLYFVNRFLIFFKKY